MSAYDLSGAAWRKSSRSNGSGGSNCVEVAHIESAVAVRDSKHPAGPVLVFTPADWRAFLSSATHDHLAKPGGT